MSQRRRETLTSSTTSLERSSTCGVWQGGRGAGIRGDGSRGLCMSAQGSAGLSLGVPDSMGVEGQSWLGSGQLPLCAVPRTSLSGCHLCRYNSRSGLEAGQKRRASERADCAGVEGISGGLPCSPLHLPLVLVLANSFFLPLCPHLSNTSPLPGAVIAQDARPKPSLGLRHHLSHAKHKWLRILPLGWASLSPLSWGSFLFSCPHPIPRGLCE